MKNQSYNFTKKTNCEKLAILSDIVEKKLVEFSKEKVDLENLKALLESLIKLYIRNIIQDPCLSCASCYDFDYYYKILDMTINNNGDLKVLARNLQIWEKTKNNDIIIDNTPSTYNQIPCRGPIKFKTDIFYFDFNIFEQIEKQELVSLVKSKNIIIVFSPIHLEEVYRMRIDIFQDIRLKTIADLTKNHVIMMRDEYLEIYNEEPNYFYQRVLENISLSEALENKRIIKSNDRAVFFETIQNEKYSRALDNQDIFSLIDEKLFYQLLFFSGCHFQIDEFKKSDKKVSQISQMIYALYDVLDNIAFTIDSKKNNNRAIRSSIYDIEHLIYATGCEHLITTDKKFARRAMQIYSFMNIETKILFIHKDFTLQSFLNSL